MTLPRFHVDLPLVVGQTTTLPRDATRHALRALRLRQGEMLTLFNGEGGEYLAQLVHAREPEAEVQLIRYEPREAEMPWPITVAQGLSSGDRMDWTIEKAVELGAAVVAPLAMTRSVTRLSGDRAKSRRDHWQALAIAASEQCGRNRIARIEPVMSLVDWLGSLHEATLRLVLAPSGAALSTVRRPPNGRRVLLLAGPEGGFTDDELQAADTGGLSRGVARTAHPAHGDRRGGRARDAVGPVGAIIAGLATPPDLRRSTWDCWTTSADSPDSSADCPATSAAPTPRRR